MLRNLLKVTQQRFKPGFLCNCKTASVCFQALGLGSGGQGAECSQEESFGLSGSRL